MRQWITLGLVGLLAMGMLLSGCGKKKGGDEAALSSSPQGQEQMKTYMKSGGELMQKGQKTQ